MFLQLVEEGSRASPLENPPCVCWDASMTRITRRPTEVVTSKALSWVVYALESVHKVIIMRALLQALGSEPKQCGSRVHALNH